MDLRREALFFFMTPDLVALSNVWKTLGSIFLASSFLPAVTSFRKSLTEALYVTIFFIFLALLVLFWRNAFLALSVIGICVY